MMKLGLALLLRVFVLLRGVHRISMIIWQAGGEGQPGTRASVRMEEASVSALPLSHPVRAEGQGHTLR